MTPQCHSPLSRGVGSLLRAEGPRRGGRVGTCRRHPLCFGSEGSSGAKTADMMDYYPVLKRKIRDASKDPVKMREVVYEAARLALRRVGKVAHFF